MLIPHATVETSLRDLAARRWKMDYAKSLIGLLLTSVGLREPDSAHGGRDNQQKQ
jgi:hypothetical protein